MDYKQMGNFLYALIIKKYNLDDERIINRKEYISKNKILNDETINFLKEQMDKMPLYKKECIIDYLCSLYLKIRTEDASLTKYLRKTEKKEIYEFFDENEYFRMELFNNFFACIYIDEWDLSKDEQKEEVKEEVKTEETINIEVLPDMLRNAYDNVSSALIENGASSKKISEIFLLMLILPGKVVAYSDEIREQIEFILANKQIFIRIMFADLLLLFDNNSDDESIRDIADYIVKCADENDYDFPESNEMSQKMLEYFILMVSDKATRIEYKKNAREEIKELYNIINPFYKLEDFDQARG